MSYPTALTALQGTLILNNERRYYCEDPVNIVPDGECLVGFYCDNGSADKEKAECQAGHE